MTHCPDRGRFGGTALAISHRSVLAENANALAP
jgi:hypothetical protein